MTELDRIDQIAHDLLLDTDAGDDAHNLIGEIRGLVHKLKQRQEVVPHDTAVNLLGFKEWLRQVTQLDSRVRHLLHQDLPYYEFSDWIDWYDNGLTPEQALSENQRQYG